MLDIKFHDLSADRVSFVYNSREVFYIKKVVKRAFYAKEL